MEGRRRGLHGGADLVRLLPGDVALLDQLRVAPVLDPRVLELGLVADDVGLGLAQLRLRLGQRRQRLLDGRLVAGAVGLGLPRLGLVLGHVGLGLLDGGLDGPWIDREQELTLLQVGAVGEVDLHDPPGDLRLDRDHLVGDALAHRVDVERRVAGDRRRDGDGRGRALECRLGLSIARGEAENEEGEQADRGQPGGPATD